MEKVVRNGKVAVLISPGFGAGWFTWNDHKQELLFNPKLIEFVEQNRHKEITEEFVEKHTGIKDVYIGGAIDLKIIWVNQGTAFVIGEYDGSESLEIIDNISIIA